MLYLCVKMRCIVISFSTPFFGSDVRFQMLSVGLCSHDSVVSEWFGRSNVLVGI